MNQRVKLLRQALQLTQSEFGEGCGLSRAEVANIESSRAPVRPATIPIICREFGVSEVWLRTGEGEMFLPRSQDSELLELLAQVDTKGDDMIRSFLLSYWRLADEEKAVIRKLVDAFYEQYKSAQ